MSVGPPVAVTGAHGRLGQALVEALRAADIACVAWSRPEFDLENIDSARRLIARDRPATIFHAAAWTDVDGCAREPELAKRRNGFAVGELAAIAAADGIRLVHVSTNEIFDGNRTDGVGYSEEDTPAPINPYGDSKLLGERLAQDAYATTGGPEQLWVIRTAWLFGPPGSDFPTKIVAAADRLTDGQPLRVVDDEVGSPTYTRDLADAIITLTSSSVGGVYHLTSSGEASRFDVAMRVLQHCRPDVRVEPMSRRDFVRVSNPPAWAVLDTTRASKSGVWLRRWQVALDDYVTSLC